MIEPPKERLSPEAEKRLGHLTAEIAARVYGEAYRIAQNRGLDMVSESHIEESINLLMQGYARQSRILPWVINIGFALIGVGLPPLIEGVIARQPINYIYVVALITGLIMSLIEGVLRSRR